MRYYIKDVDKILGFTTWDNKKKIDELLRIDTMMYAAEGMDSTKEDRDRLRVDSRRIYLAIKEIDSDLGSSFLGLMDEADSTESH